MASEGERRGSYICQSTCIVHTRSNRGLHTSALLWFQSLVVSIPVLQVKSIPEETRSLCVPTMYSMAPPVAACVSCEDSHYISPFPSLILKWGEWCWLQDTIGQHTVHFTTGRPIMRFKLRNRPIKSLIL